MNDNDFCLAWILSSPHTPLLSFSSFYFSLSIEHYYQGPIGFRFSSQPWKINLESSHAVMATPCPWRWSVSLLLYGVILTIRIMKIMLDGAGGVAQGTSRYFTLIEGHKAGTFTEVDMDISHRNPCLGCMVKLKLQIPKKTGNTWIPGSLMMFMNP